MIAFFYQNTGLRHIFNRTYMHMCTDMYTYMYTQMYTHMHTHMYTQMYTHTCTHTHMYTQTYTHAHTHMYTHMQAHMYTHVQAHTIIRTFIDATLLWSCYETHYIAMLPQYKCRFYGSRGARRWIWRVCFCKFLNMEARVISDHMTCVYLW